MAEFEVGDWVYAGDWCYGQIAGLTDPDIAYVEFNTGTGGGCMAFDRDELHPAEPPVNMRNYMYEKLKSHIGHKIVCVSYGDADNPADICIECEDCCCVLISAEDFE